MEKIAINVEKIKEELLSNLNSSGWAVKLKSFIQSSDFTEILHFLVDEKVKGRRFTPTMSHMFRAFIECPYKDLKVVFVGQDPYPKLGVADGISFSCGITKKEQPSLRYILDAVERTVYPDMPYDRDPDLKRWANQGVLMLNTALSVRLDEAGSHMEKWKPFVSYLFDFLNTYNTGLIWVFLGKKAQFWEDLIQDSVHYKLYTDHPAYTGYLKKKEWPCNDIFNKINEILINNNGTRINW
jgi:uracil-DNA glycosylase